MARVLPTSFPNFVIICGDLVNDYGNAKAIALKQYRDRLGPDHVTVEHQGWTFIGLDTQALTPADASEDAGKVGAGGGADGAAALDKDVVGEDHAPSEDFGLNRRHQREW